MRQLSDNSDKLFKQFFNNVSFKKYNILMEENGEIYSSYYSFTLTRKDGSKYTSSIKNKNLKLNIIATFEMFIEEYGIQKTASVSTEEIYDIIKDFYGK